MRTAGSLALVWCVGAWAGAGVLEVPSESYPTVQSAIDAAQAGDEVVLQRGEYVEDISIGGKDLFIRSRCPMCWGVTESTVLRGTGSGPVVTFSGEESEQCQLWGLTICGGDNAAGPGGGIQGNGTRAGIGWCVIKGNRAAMAGGGIHGCHGSIHHCIIRGNEGLYGAVAACHGLVVSCLIVENVSANAGAMNNCDGQILHCTIADNIGSPGALADCDGTVSNTILWGNTEPQLGGNRAGFGHCCGVAVDGAKNLAADPLFEGNSSWRLQVGSPCIDAGGSYLNMGMYDLDGHRRFVNRGGEGDTDSDIGCYELAKSLGPEMESSPTTLEFVVSAGEAQRQHKQIAVVNKGYGLLKWTAESDREWLSVTPAAGASEYSHMPLEVGVDSTGLTEKAYEGAIRIWQEPNGPARTVGVRLIQQGYVLEVPSAYGTIQSAIEAATDGDRVVVAPGEYVEDLHFDGKDIAVESTAPFEWAVTASTVVRGTGSGPAVTFSGEETGACRLWGLTITGGNNPSGPGGGILGRGTEANIGWCLIEGNYASMAGGGVHGCGGGLHHCIIRDNEGLHGAVAACHGTIACCLVVGNRSANAGGLNNCDGTIVHCTIADNEGTPSAMAWCDGLVMNCIVWGEGTGPIGDSEAILLNCCSPTGAGEGAVIANPLFVGGGDYRLRDASACVEAGLIDTRVPAYDLLYQARAVDWDSDGHAAPDLGAYETQRPMGVVPRLSTYELAFSSEDGVGMKEEMVRVYNGGSGESSWRIEEECEWVEATPSSGLLTLSGQEVRIQVDVAGLGAAGGRCVLRIVTDDPEVYGELVVRAQRRLAVPAQFSRIGEAINAASSGDMIVVSPGLYRESISFDGKNLILCGSDPADWQTVAATVIQSPDGGTVVRFSGIESEKCLLDGVTIRGCDDHGMPHGGAVAGSRAKARIRRCIIEGHRGWGIRGCAGPISRCIIRDNAVALTGVLAECHGPISQCLVVDNYVYSTELVVDCTGCFSNCTIAGNTGLGNLMARCTGAIVNTILNYNELELPHPSTVGGRFVYCLLPASYAQEGRGTLTGDPGFVGNGDWSLRRSSPCIDAGYLYEDSREHYDVAGKYRIQDGDGDEEPRIDIGAYEFVRMPGAVRNLQVSADALHFGAMEHEAGAKLVQMLDVIHAGGEPLDWEIEGGAEWLTVSPRSGTGLAETAEITLEVDTARVTGDGQYACQLRVVDRTNGGERAVMVRFSLYAEDAVVVPYRFESIEAAVAAVNTGGEVLLADGVYRDQFLYQVNKAVTLRSEYGPQRCILDGIEMGSRQWQLFGLLSVTGGTVLEGLTIRNCPVGAVDVRDGPADVPVVVRNCRIENNGPTNVLNSDIYGGGISSRYGRKLMVENSVIQGNRARVGGGIYCSGADLEVTGCEVNGNVAATEGGGIFIRGATSDIPIRGVPVNRLTVLSSRIERNRLLGDAVFPADLSAGGGGAGIWAETLIETLLSDTLIAGNVCLGENLCGAGVRGDLMTAVNCTVVGNRSSRRAGGLFGFGGLHLENCIVWGNYAPRAASQILQHTIVGENWFSDAICVEYCVIQDEGILQIGPALPDRREPSPQDTWEVTELVVAELGAGNHFEDPMFLWGCHLSGRSPCVNAGRPGLEWLGASDVDGEPRVGGCRIDIGCDEYYDWDGDETGRVDLGDLGLFGAAWGCDCCSCFVFDYNQDLVVDVYDLLLLSGSWMEEVWDTGPLAWWPLDGNAYDVTHGHDAVAAAEAITGAEEARIGIGALRCGSHGGAECLDFRGVGGMQARTCAAWVRTDRERTSGILPIVAWGSEEAGQRWLVLLADSPEVHDLLGVRVAVSEGYAQGGSGLGDGEWHHVAVVLRPDLSTTPANIEIYVDGVREEVHTVGGSPAIFTSENEVVRIGVWDGMQFEGWIDDVRIYDRALGEEVIRGLAAGK